MHLLIRAVSLAGQPLTQAISAYFDERGGTIGRSDTNTLALPDPERRISRLQAELSRSPDGWRILNVGNANPIWHNNRPVPPGEGVLLDEGDELQIGTYALQVTYSQNDATARTITKGRAAVDSRTVIVGSGQEPRTDPSLMRPEPTAPVAVSPFAAMLPAGAPSASPGAGQATPSAASPFADLLGFGAPASSSSPFSTPASAPSSGAATARLPDDFDPFADFQSAPSSPARSAPASSAMGGWDLPQAAQAPASTSPFDLGSPGAALPGDLDLMGQGPSGGGPSIDQLFGLGAASSASDPLAAFLKQTEPAAPAQASAGAPSQLDPLSLLASREEVRQAPQAQGDALVQPAPPPALPDDVPELQAAMALPAVMPIGVPAAAPGAQAKPTEPMSATFSFMPPERPQVAASQPVLDLQADTASAARHLPLADWDLSAPVGHAPLAEPLQTQLPIPQTTLPHQPFSAVPVPVPEAVQAAPVQAVASPAAVREAGAPAPTDLPTDTSSQMQALWAAFCEGSGVKFNPPQGLNPDLMRVIGQLLHHAVDGSLKLVAARAATKQEMRAEVTVIQARRNNPLKFSPDTESAMEQLLQPPLRGFMSGPEAVADAMDDLLGHTIGTMVGMRAALDGVLARFEPEQLEAKLVGRSMLDSLLPMNRRAKLWELYLQHYGAVRAEAQDDFHNLFGRAFLQAYEEQLDRLDAERRQSGRVPHTPA